MENSFKECGDNFQERRLDFEKKLFGGTINSSKKHGIQKFLSNIL